MQEKRGQVTIFIIIGIVVVGLAIVIYFLSSGTDSDTESGFDEQNPVGFIQTCLEDEVESVVNTVSLQGGSINPGNSILYQGNDVEYLCYQYESWQTCSIQRPLLKSHIESEIQGEIIDDVQNCFNSLVENYESRNYNPQLSTGLTRVELLPKRIVISMDYVLTVTRGETERYDSFNIVLNNNLYELVSIANSIVDFEAIYGEADPGIYMTLYKDLKVEAISDAGGDGSTIYVLTDRNNEKSFQFASRSVAFPPSGQGIVATN